MKYSYIVDMDGTLYRGDDPIDGAPLLIECLQRHSYVLMTNCPLHSSDELSHKLRQMGMTVPADKIITSGTLAVNHMLSLQIKRLCLVGSPPLCRDIARAGIVSDDTNPQAVLVSHGSEATDEKLSRVILLLRQGVPLYCTNMDMQVPNGDHFVPHTGYLVRQLETMSGCTAINIGKPETGFVDIACKLFHCTPDRLILIGDNPETDIAMGKRCGATTYLVMTGVTTDRHSELLLSQYHPTKVFDDLHMLVSTEFEK